MNRRAGALVLFYLVVFVVAAPAAVAATGDEVIRLEQELVATEEPGEIEVVLRFEVPESVIGLRTTVPEDATVTDIHGFEPAGEEYEWSGGTRSPTLTYTVPTDRAFEEGGLVFVDTGEWALVERPRTSVRWRWVGAERVGLERTTTTERGAVGVDSAFLGGHVVDVRETGHETVALVVPSAASPVESPDAIHAAIGNATERLRVGGRSERVFVVVAPSIDGWGVRGLQFGPSDVWVREDSRLDDPDNVWIHEYVHTRQEYETSEEVRWIDEATAVYYAALLTYERGDVGFEAFRDRLASGERSPHADDVLADPGTWTRGPDYHKGALVAADLDRRIRLASGGERDLQDVLRAMNDHEGRITQSAFLGYVEAAGGPEVREVAREHTETAAGPTAWNEAAHREAFDLTAPRIEYRLAGAPGAYRVSGPYRDRPLAPEEGIVLVAGERLRTTATVENVGDAAGEYATTVAAGGTDRTVEGHLEPGERAEIAIDRTFERPGTYALSAGDASVDVRVVEPAEPTVTDVEPASTTVASDEVATLVVTVENDASVPGRADLELLDTEGVRGDRIVRLDAGETETVEFATRFETAGERELRVGDRSATVTVEPALAATQPGFGVPVAVVALALVLFSAAPRRPRGRR